MRKLFVGALLAVLFTANASAVSPPTPTIVQQKALFSWIMPTTRVNGATLALSEIKTVNIYVSSLSSVINVAAPTISYTYILPPGVCIKKTDSIQATATDTIGQESAASPPTFIDSDVCGPNPPASPTSVKVTAG